MIDQKPRDPLYPQGFEDIDNLKNRQIPRPKPKENEEEKEDIWNLAKILQRWILKKEKKILKKEVQEEDQAKDVQVDTESLKNIKLTIHRDLQFS